MLVALFGEWSTVTCIPRWVSQWEFLFIYFNNVLRYLIYTVGGLIEIVHSIGSFGLKLFVCVHDTRVVSWDMPCQVTTIVRVRRRTINGPVCMGIIDGWTWVVIEKPNSQTLWPPRSERGAHRNSRWADETSPFVFRPRATNKKGLQSLCWNLSTVSFEKRRKRWIYLEK